jgi:predicted pyridoxine 5'-phosphate oxidase superfamily flavin-nucleotide-binding protein
MVMPIENPYHEGELLTQKRAGELEEGRRNSQMISDSIIHGALKFINQQPLAIMGSLDKELNVWASVLVGQPGFMTAVDEQTVEFDLTRSAENSEDPFWTNIEDQSQVGMLLIELGTRRRLRINGRITRSAPEHLRLEVEAAYPNCPKYIQRRQLTISDSKGSSTPRRGRFLEDDQLRLIRSADTFFVTSAHPTRGVDASHKGGNPGFVSILDNRKIRIPDYVGNSMFNTLGNFAENPRAGLLFLDFESNRTLQLIGRPEIQWELDAPLNETGRTKRYWDLDIDRWLETDMPYRLEWEFLDYSPHNPASDNSVTRSEHP